MSVELRSPIQVVIDFPDSKGNRLYVSNRQTEAFNTPIILRRIEEFCECNPKDIEGMTLNIDETIIGFIDEADYYSGPWLAPYSVYTCLKYSMRRMCVDYTS